MHLTMLALRILAIEAITGHTWVGDAVFDSPSSIEDIKIESDRAAFINVYVDEGDSNTESDPGIGTPGAEASIRLILEVGVAGAYTTKPADGDEPTTTIHLAASDAGLEAQIALISRQAVDALKAVGPDFPWAEAFRKLTSAGIIRTEVRRGGQPGEGKNAPRYAAQVTILHVMPLTEPHRGIDLDQYPVWKQVLEAIETSVDYGDIGTLMRQHIEPPSGPVTYAQSAATALQMTAEATDMAGLGERAFPKTTVANWTDATDLGPDVPLRPGTTPATPWPDGYPEGAFPPGQYEPDPK